MVNPPPEPPDAATPASARSNPTVPPPVIDIFRKEVLARRGARLYGEISLAVPLRWSLLIGALALALVAAAVYVSTAGYTRVETVAGTITPDVGVAAVMTTRPGVVRELMVREGDAVAASDPLFLVRVSETLTSGSVGSDRLNQTLADQRTQTNAQLSATNDLFLEQQRGYRDQIGGLDAELAQLLQQISIQENLVALALQTLDRTREIASNGFISQQTVQAREETYLLRRQQLASLRQSQASKQAARVEAAGDLERLLSQHHADRAAGQVRLGDLDRQTIEADAASGYLVTAPVAGVVTSLTARVGQPVDGLRPVALVLPHGYALIAELTVPASVISRIEEGQTVRLEVDGYPVARYGSIRAVVTSIPAAAVARSGEQAQSVIVYTVTCRILEPADRLGNDRKLRPGMAVTGRIATRHETLLHWLLEPLSRAFRG